MKNAFGRVAVVSYNKYQILEQKIQALYFTQFRERTKNSSNYSYINSHQTNQIWY